MYTHSRQQKDVSQPLSQNATDEHYVDVLKKPKKVQLKSRVNSFWNPQSRPNVSCSYMI
ncbi:Uncharacterized protein TCM_041009 [Theobroma cacao]|uniref:Uncharacterized protein n=1 Tax=Theobroma cacao TaxID=3641 RepID=A0A061GUY7_THECC|nr:Uncharacterized protein TCM_041009 [Theobroma cacao]